MREKRTLPASNLLFIDIETRDLSAANDASTEVYFICCKESGSDDIQVFIDTDEFIAYLHSNNFWLVYHNAKFDHRVLSLRGLDVPISRVLDTQVLSYLLDNTKDSYSLDALTGEKTDIVQLFINAGVLEDKISKADFWNRYWGEDAEALNLMLSYCKDDIKATEKLYKHIRKHLHPQCLDAYFNIQQPMLEVLNHIETVGAKIDVSLLDSLIKQKTEEVNQLMHTINTNAGLLPELQWKGDSYVPKEKIYKTGQYKNKRHSIPFYVDNEGIIKTAWEGHIVDDNALTVYNHCNLVSYNPAPATGHTWWILNLHCPDVFKKAKVNRKTSKPSLGGKFFKKVAKKIPDWFPIAQLTEVTKKLQMAESIAKFVQSDGRVYGTYNHTLTLTGRLSSSNP